MKIIGIDPGPDMSAICELDETLEEEQINCEHTDNKSIIRRLATIQDKESIEFFIEYPFLRGCYPSNQVIQTASEIGRFAQAFLSFNESVLYVSYINSKDWRAWLCGKNNANDTAVRQVLFEIYGGSQKIAKGTKKEPGKLYKFSGSHMYDALAIALYGRYLIETNQPIKDGCSNI